MEPAGSYPYQLRLEARAGNPAVVGQCRALRPEALRPHLSVSMRIDGGYYAYGREPPQPTRPAFCEVKLLSIGRKGFDGCDGDHTCCSYTRSSAATSTSNRRCRSVAAMKNNELAVPLRVYTNSGELIAQIGEQRRNPVQYEQIPRLVKKAFIAAEDDQFFEHHGFDWQGILRSAVRQRDVRARRQGGSTITMQAARSAFFTQEQTVRRKLQEIFVTLAPRARFHQAGNPRAVSQRDLLRAALLRRRRRGGNLLRQTARRAHARRSGDAGARAAVAVADTTRSPIRRARPNAAATCCAACASSATSTPRRPRRPRRK